MNHTTHAAGASSLNQLAFSATMHCLTGCSIGEVLGMVIGTALGWSNWATVALAVVLAFVFGYLLTLLPLFRAGIALDHCSWQRACAGTSPSFKLCRKGPCGRRLASPLASVTRA
ncbi:MAG: DUF4396 domain-containing protein [Burkholderiales bacterium]